MASTQKLMFTTLMDSAMAMLKDTGSASHEDFVLFADYVANCEIQMSKMQYTIEVCKTLAENIDDAEDCFEEITSDEDYDSDSDGDYDDDDESEIDSESESVTG